MLKIINWRSYWSGATLSTDKSVNTFFKISWDCSSQIRLHSQLYQYLYCSWVLLFLNDNIVHSISIWICYCMYTLQLIINHSNNYFSWHHLIPLYHGLAMSQLQPINTEQKITKNALGLIQPLSPKSLFKICDWWWDKVFFI